jgi:hypothetical protein
MRKAIKAIGVFAILVLCAAVIGSFREGNIKHVHRTIPQSSIYSEQEISVPMDIVEKKFKRDFGGCTLTDLWYDEKRSESESNEWAEQYHADEAIVLLSNFYVGSNADQCFNPNSSYTYWSWVLVHKTGGPWELKTWGLP